MKTYSAKLSEINREWFVIDAAEAPLGRVCTRVADILNGKYKPSFTKHVDCGDHVIVINSDKLIVTGNKRQAKIYYSHSQYPGSLKETMLKDQLNGDSTKVIFHAVRGMLPKNKLIDGRLKRLHIYKEETHNHQAQKPQKVSIKK